METIYTKQYKFLKIFGIISLLITTAIALVILIEGLIPGDKSAIQSDAISDIVQDIVDVEIIEKPTPDSPEPLPDQPKPDKPQMTLDEFRLLVRKSIGHFGAFMVLGFWLAITTIIFSKTCPLASVISIISGFVIAGVSEMFQLPAFTTGRYASWKDIGIDTLGAFCGVVLVFIIVLIVALILKKYKPNNYFQLKTAKANLTIKTAFSKNIKKCDDTTTENN